MKYLTKGKLNTNTMPTFWKLTYWGDGGEKSVQFEEDKLPQITLAFETKTPVVINGKRIAGGIIRTIEPDYERFLNWSDDHLLIDDNGFQRYYLQDRTIKGVERVAKPIHDEVHALISQEVHKAIKGRTVKQLLATPVNKIKQKLLN